MLTPFLKNGIGNYLQFTRNVKLYLQGLLEVWKTICNGCCKLMVFLLKWEAVNISFPFFPPVPLVCLILTHLWTAYCLCFLRFFSTPLEGSSPPLTLCFLPPKPHCIILPYLRIIPEENETDFILIKTNSYRNAAYHFLIPVHHNPCCFGSSYTVSSPSSLWKVFSWKDGLKRAMPREELLC